MRTTATGAKSGASMRRLLVIGTRRTGTQRISTHHMGMRRTDMLRINTPPTLRVRAGRRSKRLPSLQHLLGAPTCWTCMAHHLRKTGFL